MIKVKIKLVGLFLEKLVSLENIYKNKKNMYTVFIVLGEKKTALYKFIFNL